MVYIGLRDIDPYEAFILNKVGIRYYAMDVSTLRIIVYTSKNHVITLKLK